MPMGFGKRNTEESDASAALDLRPAPLVGGLAGVLAGKLERLGLFGRTIEDMLCDAYLDQNVIHCETVLAAAAALTGEFALRATQDLNGQPLQAVDGWVRGGQVDALLFGNEAYGKPALWTFIKQGGIQAGLIWSQIPHPESIAMRAERAIGRSPFPPLTVASENFPTHWPPNACVRHRATIRKLAREMELGNNIEIAIGLAFAVSFLIVRTRESLSPRIATRLVAEVMLGVARMEPLHREV